MNPKRDHLESKRFLFFSIGLLISLSLCFSAFNWRNFEEYSYNLNLVEFEELPIDTIKPQLKIIQAKSRTLSKKKTPKAIKEKTEIDLKSIESKIDTKITDSIFIDPDEGLEPIEFGNVASEKVYSFSSISKPPFFNYKNMSFSQYVSWNISLSDINVPNEFTVRFILNEEGVVDRVEFTKNISKQAKSRITKLLKEMPNWDAAEFNGKKVKVWCELPFRLVN